LEYKDLRTDVDGVLIDLESFTEEYDIRIDLTEPVNMEELSGRFSRLFKLNIDGLNAYLLETPYLLRYVTHPHIVGEGLIGLFQDNASILQVVVSRFMLERFGKLVFAGDSELGKLFRLEDMGIVPLNTIKGENDIVLVIPVAGNHHGESLELLYEQAREQGGRVTVILFIGLLDEQLLYELSDVANSLGVDSIFLSMVGLGGKNSLGEGILYGPDIGMLEKRVLLNIGSVIDQSTLCKVLRDYPPGMDFTLHLVERIKEGMVEYLRSLLMKLLFLLEQPIFEPWQHELLLREAKSTRRQLVKYENG